MATFTNWGIDNLTKLQLGSVSNAPLHVHLYSNNQTPTATSTTGSFQEVNFGGYSSFTLSPSNWTGSVVGNQAQYAYPTIGFNFAASTGNGSVYGFYISDSSDQNIFWAELLSPTYNVPTAGGQLNLTLNFDSQPCS